jgi:hypothetical protein
MELTFNQMNGLYETLMSLRDKTLPFKLSLIVAKNISKLETELNFYIDQERNFANTYLQKGEDGNFIQEAEGVFKIIEGKEEECRTAREELDKFTTNVDLRMIPMSLVENLELTPKEVGALEVIIEEE